MALSDLEYISEYNYETVIETLLNEKWQLIEKMYHEVNEEVIAILLEDFCATLHAVDQDKLQNKLYGHAIKSLIYTIETKWNILLCLDNLLRGEISATLRYKHLVGVSTEISPELLVPKTSEAVM